jgi:hypothetical protein
MRPIWNSALLGQSLKLFNVHFLRLILIILTATAVHSAGIANSISIYAVPFIDHVTFLSTSIQAFAYLSVSFFLARLMIEFMGAEIVSKRMRRDRDAGRPVLQKTQYYREDDYRSGIAVFGCALVFFAMGYFRGYTALLIAALPAIAYFFFFLLGEYWALVNRFGRPGQSPASVRIVRIAKRRPALAIKRLVVMFLNWLKPRLTGFIAITILCSGIARGISIQQDLSSIEVGGKTLHGAIVFRNADGVVIYNHFSNQAFFMSYGGILISIRAGGRLQQNDTAAR